MNGNGHQKLPYLTADLPSRMRIAQVWDIMEDVTRAVAFIHSEQEIHRDLKARNGIGSHDCNETHWILVCIRPKINLGKSLISVSQHMEPPEKLTVPFMVEAYLAIVYQNLFAIKNTRIK